MNRLEWVNLLVFGAIGAYVAGLGVYNLFTQGYSTMVWEFGFNHPAPTFIISGLGLIALSYRWGVYGFPLFLMAVNFSDMPWLLSDFNWNILQIVFLLFGYALARPSFKQPLYLVIIALVNMMGPFPSWEYFGSVDWHRAAEIGIFLVLMFDIKELKSPLRKFRP